MCNYIYWVSTLIYAIVLTIILIHDKKLNKQIDKVEAAYRKLITWVIFFCLQDVVWGIIASTPNNNAALFVSSTVFHLSMVITTFFWLNYVLTYLEDAIEHYRLFMVLYGIVLIFQIILVITNFFKPTLFYIEDGIYRTSYFRPVSFFNQYVVYIVIGLVTLVYAHAGKDEARKKYRTVFVFALAPMLAGIFQLLDPYGPFYSMGYFLGCFIIHIFIVSNDRDELIRLQHEKKMEEQIQKSITDELTGLRNRRAYEEDLEKYPKVPVEPDFVYVSADVNGLKVTNDTLGHAAGDELLVGAAECMKRCIAPYGRIYRIGGDEFAAIIFASPEQLEVIKADLNDTVAKWCGEIVNKLSLSIAYVKKIEFPRMSVMDIAREADAKMYKEKAKYYNNKGIDKREQQAAYQALCETYEKILKINLTYDTYKIIRIEEWEKAFEKGFSERLSQWLHDFGTSGQVQEEDLENYLKLTDINYLRDYFRINKRPLNVFYKRLTDGSYRLAKMEIILADDYSDDNQSLYLYVKNIDK